MLIAFIQGIGPLELVIVLVIVLLIFGPKRLPALLRSAGTGMRELKDGFRSKADDESGEDGDRLVLAPSGAAAGEAVRAAPSAEAVPERR